MSAVHERPEVTWPLRQSADIDRAYEVYDAISTALHEGELKPGFVLTYPTISDLFKITWDTTYYALLLLLLRRAGLVETRPRLGTRVAVAGETWHPPEKNTSVRHSVWIERKIRERLADGDYPAGERLPSMVALADEFGVSNSTVRQALCPLFAAGYLVTSRYKRSGTRVALEVAEVSRDELLQLSEPQKRPRGRRVAAFGESKTLPEWSMDPRCAVSYPVLKTRYLEHGWPLDRAIRSPLSS